MRNVTQFFKRAFFLALGIGTARFAIEQGQKQDALKPILAFVVPGVGLTGGTIGAFTAPLWGEYIPVINKLPEDFFLGMSTFGIARGLREVETFLKFKVPLLDQFFPRNIG